MRVNGSVQRIIQKLRHAADPIVGVCGLLQAPGPIPMASARQIMKVSLVESFGRALGVFIFMISLILGMLALLRTQSAERSYAGEPLPPGSGSQGS